MYLLINLRYFAISSQYNFLEGKYNLISHFQYSALRYPSQEPTFCLFLWSWLLNQCIFFIGNWFLLSFLKFLHSLKSNDYVLDIASFLWFYTLCSLEIWLSLFLFSDIKHGAMALIMLESWGLCSNLDWLPSIAGPQWSWWDFHLPPTERFNLLCSCVGTFVFLFVGLSLHFGEGFLSSGFLTKDTW